MFKSNKPAAEMRLKDRLKAISDRTTPTSENIEEAAPTGQRSPRAPTFKQAVLVFPHGERLPVVIKNLSETGARIEFFQKLQIAGDVRLVEQSTDLNRKARIVWQLDELIGLTFTE
jgi:PilZ domain